LSVISNCKQLENQKRNAIVLHSNIEGVENLHYWINQHVDGILSFGLRPIITSCMYEDHHESTIVYWDNAQNAIYVKKHSELHRHIWSELYNFVSYRKPLTVLSEDGHDTAAFLTSEKIAVAIIPVAFYVDNVIRYYEWVNKNREDDRKYGFIREAINDGFEGHLLKSLGHFRHLPNESRLRLLIIDKKPALAIKQVYL
jgi:hypothetical protein